MLQCTQVAEESNDSLMAGIAWVKSWQSIEHGGAGNRSYTLQQLADVYQQAKVTAALLLAVLRVHRSMWSLLQEARPPHARCRLLVTPPMAWRGPSVCRHPCRSTSVALKIGAPRASL